ncbi:glycosyltransferase [Streptococcus moroccensis]|uniref:1,2-diacylglycerol-3-alpha-glucose alpha-1,2-glucosyltransferase n=1 Tax=Streptococcus moroccensis TaxID=1451356 RepID=A0ABT9YPG0_9STRE|nr:glycosyltransferase [Streptococcus moroccensis]MDQ0221877.1 1,2-diacylglycerol-3-alpha-glucose alpha-1,2-glucosyltransferase [Streptococcus moroccensis]
MKILLYLEGEKLISKSGIGRAIKHQERALTLAGIDYTTNVKEDYDIVHINTYGFRSLRLLRQAKRQGKRVIVHAHSTKEDFENSFKGSNLLAPMVKNYLAHFYQQADHIITPTPYSESLLRSYGITRPISAISNGIELSKYQPDPQKETRFREYFNLEPHQKVVISAGLYFKRKGIVDFVKVAEQMPHVRFIWFGQINKLLIPHDIVDLVEKNHPANVSFPGYIKGPVFEGAMSGADAFFFPSHEETEGIVVLEALASHQHVLVRDIPVYQGWLDRTSVTMGRTNEEFVAALDDILGGQIDRREAGFQVAKGRAIEEVSRQLAAVYRKVME